MKIIIGNVFSRAIIGGMDYTLDHDLEKLLKGLLRVRKPGYQHTDAYKRKVWDGYTKLYSSKLEFATGFLVALVPYLERHGAQIELVDERTNKVTFDRDFTIDVGNSEGWKLTEEQALGVMKIIHEKVQSIPFNRGIWDAATNAGKTSMAAGLINNVPGGRAIIYCDRADFFNGTHKFMCDIYGSENVGKVQGKKVELDRRVVLAMVGSLKNKLDSINVRSELKRFPVMLLDECHRGGSDTVIACTAATDAYVRVFMSGTSMDIKDKYKKLIQVGQAGRIVLTISNKDLIEKGRSLRPICNIYLSTTGRRKHFVNYQQEYSAVVVNSQHRRKQMCEDMLMNRGVNLVAVRYKNHGKILYEYFKQNLPGMRVEFVHAGSNNLDGTKEEFRAGNIDVLISTSIMQEGGNYPKITKIWFAQGGKDQVAVKQFYGRSARLDETNEDGHVYFNDFWDIGPTVSKHSRARIKYLLKEGFEVRFHYKKNSQHTPIFD